MLFPVSELLSKYGRLGPLIEKAHLARIEQEATVAFDVCAEDGGEFTFKTFLCHVVTPICYGF